MDAALKGKVVLITGAGRGIGRAAALAFAKVGASLVLCARSAEVEETARAAEKLGAQVLARRLDVSDEKAVRTLVADAVVRFGRLDAAFNNAALLGPRGPLSEHSLADWRAVLDTNLTGTFVVLNAAAEAMRKTKSGSIVNLTSGAGRSGRAGGGAYTASKFGVEGLTQVAAAELQVHGIRVNALNPRPTRTSMRAAYAPEEDPSTLKAPDDIAWAFLELASPDGDTGKSYDVDMETRRLVAVR
jgi:NAD(P)-dependent dehydrogenase (short-subunit alcohol dehydrogenase family)